MRSPIENADFGQTATDYLMHRAGFPDSLFERLADRHSRPVGTKHERVVDLGTGTGTLGRGFARQGCKVTGVDPAGSMLDAAREADRSLGLDTCYLEGCAEDTGLPANSFDLVTAGQCWHWFDAKRATDEIRRLLAPNGLLLVAYYDWLPLDGNMVRRTEMLIEQYNPAWRAGSLTGIHPELFRDLGENGFEQIESFTYDEPALYSHESWRGRIRASAGIAATLDSHEVEKFDQALADLLAREFPTEPESVYMSVPHRVFVTTASPG